MELYDIETQTEVYTQGVFFWQILFKRKYRQKK